MDKIIIPFGEECYTCQSIDYKFSQNPIRKKAFPFDYVGHTFVKQIYDNIVDLLELDEYNCKNDDFYLQLFGDKYFMVHNKYKFNYWHDISGIKKEDITSEDIKEFLDKYNRRYLRLKDTLKNHQNITILSINHFDNIYGKITSDKKEYINKLFEFLKSHNKNLNFVALNFGEDIFKKEDLEFVNLPVDYNLPFSESKDLFTQKIMDYVKNKF